MSEHPVLVFVRSKLADPSQPFCILADLTAHPDGGDEVAAVIAASNTVALSQAEPGCLAYNLIRDVESPDRFVAYESWRDIKALQEHLDTPHFASVGASLAPLLASAPTIRILTPVEIVNDA